MSILTERPGEGDAAPLSTSERFTTEFHGRDLLAAYDAAEREGGLSAEVRTSRITDRRILLAIRAHAEFWAPCHGKGIEGEYADRVFSSAVFLMAEAVRLADTPQTRAALRNALDMIAGE